MPPNWWKIAALALTALCLLGLFATEIADTDFWWHLKTGQYLVEQRALPVPDPFAFTTAASVPAYAGEERVRHFNLTHEWGMQLILSRAEAIGGAGGLVLLRSLLLTFFCGLTGWLACMLVLAYLSHSMLTIAYLAWAARMRRSGQMQFAVAGWREAAGLAGALLANMIPAQLTATTQPVDGMRMPLAA